MTLIHHGTHRARKRHTCDECLHPIDAGTVYVRQCLTDAGYARTYRAHTECYEFARDFFDADGPGFVLDEYRSEALDADPPPVVRARLEVAP